MEGLTNGIIYLYWLSTLSSFFYERLIFHKKVKKRLSKMGYESKRLIDRVEEDIKNQFLKKTTKFFLNIIDLSIYGIPGLNIYWLYRMIKTLRANDKNFMKLIKEDYTARASNPFHNPSYSIKLKKHRKPKARTYKENKEIRSNVSLDKISFLKIEKERLLAFKTPEKYKINRLKR